MTYWRALYVTLLKDSEVCTITVTNLNRTDSGENKIKVASLMMSSEPGFQENHDICDAPCVTEFISEASILEDPRMQSS